MDVLNRAGVTSGRGEGFSIVSIMFFSSASKTEPFPKAVSVFGGVSFAT